MRLLVAILALALAGCTKRDIPSDAPKPVLVAWVAATGKSMLPTFPEAALVEAEFGVSYESLAKGQTVLAWDYTVTPARFIHHRLVAKQGGSWIIQGDNLETNPRADRPWVTPENFIARTTGRHAQFIFAPTP